MARADLGSMGGGEADKEGETGGTGDSRVGGDWRGGGGGVTFRRGGAACVFFAGLLVTWFTPGPGASC